MKGLGWLRHIAEIICRKINTNSKESVHEELQNLAYQYSSGERVNI